VLLGDGEVVGVAPEFAFGAIGFCGVGFEDVPPEGGLALDELVVAG
jgi:hypothetical protein